MNGATTTSLPSILAAPAVEARQSMVVSVHDVAPATRDACEKVIVDLARHGVTRCSILAVPNYHHSGQSMADSSFRRWLQSLEERGNEIALHGYFHERPRRTDESLRARAITRFYTQDEGEFYDLDYDEAFRRISQARDEFVAAGLRPRGFIAPAWLLSVGAERATADAEMEYTARLTNVRDLRSGETFSARSLVYSVRNAWRRAASLAWNGALFRQLHDAPLIRLSIHPVDYGYPAVWDQIVRFIKQMAEARRATTYLDWIGEQRVLARNES
ncbi:MAG: uncharacterized protein QOI04_1075 [Verrucomicrobiota bacterium]